MIHPEHRQSLLVYMLFVAVVWIASLADAQNFVCYQNHPFSQQLVNRAEECRRDIAIAWFGEELPPWREPCVVTWTSVGGGGVTQYNTNGSGQPVNMRMTVRGGTEGIMNGTLPHEVFHLLIYDYLNFRIPRWMDEGGATTVESDAIITARENDLIRHLQQGRVMPVNELFVQTSYPADMLPLYTQSASLCRWLLAKRGSENWLELARVHYRTRSWTQAFRQVYGYESLAQVQADWMNWVSAGSPEFEADEGYGEEPLGAVTKLKPIPKSQAPYRPTGPIRGAIQRGGSAVRGMLDCSDGSCGVGGRMLGSGNCSGGTCLPSGQGSTPGRPVITPQPRPSSPSKVAIDYDELAEALAKIPKVRGPQGETGEPGPKGDPGPPGPPGKDAEITQELLGEVADMTVSKLNASGLLNPGLSQDDLEKIVTAVTDNLQNDPRFQGDTGPASELTPELMDELVARVSAAVKHPSTRMLIVDGKTRTVIDDKTYAPGEPILIDFQNIKDAIRRQGSPQQ